MVYDGTISSTSIVGKARQDQMNDVVLKNIWDDLHLRLNAFNKLEELGICGICMRGSGYEPLMKLIGRKDIADSDNFTDDEARVLQMLAGPYARVIYKILVIRNTASVKPV